MKTPPPPSTRSPHVRFNELSIYCDKYGTRQWGCCCRVNGIIIINRWNDNLSMDEMSCQIFYYGNPIGKKLEKKNKYQMWDDALSLIQISLKLGNKYTTKMKQKSLRMHVEMNGTIALLFYLFHPLWLVVAAACVYHLSSSVSHSFQFTLLLFILFIKIEIY